MGKMGKCFLKDLRFYKNGVEMVWKWKLDGNLTYVYSFNVVFLFLCFVRLKDDFFK